MKFIKTLFLVVLPSTLLLFLAFFLIHFFTGYEVHRDVRYGDLDKNTMDIYLPNNAIDRESNGCILMIHGGSWSGGDKSEEEIRCRMLASSGYVAVSINYSLWSEESKDSYTVLDVPDELDSALSKVKEFSAERGVNVDKAAIAGYSAGAHLALLYSYSRGDTAPMDITFTASMAGPADISTEAWGEDMAARVGTRLTGTEITADMLGSDEIQSLLKSVSPTSYVDENAPPTLIMHGGRDTVVPIENAKLLMNKLSAYSVPYDYVYLENSDHSLLQDPIKHLSFYKMLLSYCNTYFGY